MKTIDSPFSFYQRAKEILSEDTESLKSTLETWKDHLPDGEPFDSRMYCCEGAFLGGEKSVMQSLAAIIRDELNRRSGIDPEKEILFKYYTPDSEEGELEKQAQYDKIEARTGSRPIY